MIPRVQRHVFLMFFESQLRRREHGWGFNRLATDLANERTLDWKVVIIYKWNAWSISNPRRFVLEHGLSLIPTIESLNSGIFFLCFQSWKSYMIFFNWIFPPLTTWEDVSSFQPGRVGEINWSVVVEDVEATGSTCLLHAKDMYVFQRYATSTTGLS